jgi:hypothetical protein
MSDTSRSPMVTGPHTAGLCRYCRRQMWRGHTTGTGLLPAADTVEGACTTCAKWILEHPGEDPREAKGTTAELVPAMRHEHSRGWRHDPARACATAEPRMFDPDPDRDDPEADETYRALLRHSRATAAVEYCAGCPLRYLCRAKAHRHGYEGLWGGVVFGRLRWTDYLSGEQGYTRHATPGWIANRERVMARRSGVAA